MGAIVLFDGVCNFCSSSVNFIIARDRRRYFKFAALQSDEGRRLIEQYGLADIAGDTGTDGRRASAPESVVLIEDGKAYTHSAAALRIARRLGGAWPLLYALVAVPAFIRDAGYRLIARNRYRLFGRKDECMIPTPDVRERFLA